MRRLLGLGSSLRWGAAALLGLLAVSQAARALGGLSAGASWLGAGAIVALAVLTVLGFLELLRARLRIGEELIAMGERPAAGRLVEARRARLSEIAALGGRPDPTVLAERASADERGRAYLGRYLVGVAVLIGLVGTFSGLAQALRGLPAIVAGADALSLPRLLAMPLAGLDLVFAAGVVGILSTLTLALAQGDLQLHEEQALARLEDETLHVLIPTLWPQAQSSEARAVRELAALRGETQALAATLVGAVEAQTKALSAELLRGTVAQASLVETLRSENQLLRAEAQASLLQARQALAGALTDAGGAIERASLEAIDALREGSRASTASMETAVRASTTSMEEVVRASAASIDQTMRAQVASIEQAMRTSATSLESAALAIESAAQGITLEAAADRAATRDALCTVAADAGGALRAALGESLGRLEDGLAASRADLGAVLSASRDEHEAALASSRCDLEAALASRHAELQATLAANRVDLDATMDASRAALDRLVDGALGSLAGSAERLTAAACTLAGAQERLAPQIETLAPELRGLTQEVALLGARSLDDAEQPLFADELVRLGDSVARIEALVRLAQGAEAQS